MTNSTSSIVRIFTGNIVGRRRSGTHRGSFIGELKIGEVSYDYVMLRCSGEGAWVNSLEVAERGKVNKPSEARGGGAT